MHKIIKNLTCHNFFNLKPLHQSEINKTSDKGYYVYISRHGSAQLKLSKIFSGICNQAATHFLLIGQGMTKRGTQPNPLRLRPCLYFLGGA